MRIDAWVDGGARGNPGPAGWGAHLRIDGGRERLEMWGFLGKTTNNVAEYRGLIAALDEALALGATELHVRTDSQLIQRQVTGQYKVRQPHLQQLLREVRERSAKLRRFTVVHVRREENRDADRLANRAMDERGDGRLEGAAP